MLKFTSRCQLATCFTENFKFINSRSALFKSKCIRNHLAAGLARTREEAYSASQIPSWIKGVGPGKEKGEGEGNKEKGKKEPEGEGKGREEKEGGRGGNGEQGIGASKGTLGDAKCVTEIVGGQK